MNDGEGGCVGGPVGLISNPASGHNRDQFVRLRERIDASPTILHRVTGSLPEVLPVLEEFAAQRIGLLAINGGDGTASAVLGELLESGLFPDPPTVALLPGGTANMNAGDIGVRGTLRRAITRFCNWCDGPRDTRGLLQARSLLRLASADGSAPRYGMFLGAGAVISGTEYAHRELHSRGLRDDFSLALGTLRTGWGLLRGDPAFRRHVPLQLAMDGGEPRQFEALILAVSTLQRLAFGMRPFWGDEPGALRLTLIDGDCTRFAPTFTSILRGRPNRNAVPGQGYHSYNAGRLALELDGALNLDGEVFTPAGPLRLEASRELAFLRL